MRRAAIAVCLSAALLASTAGPTGAATLAPTSASFGNEPVGDVSVPKTFTVTADPVDAVLPLTVATTGDFKQTNNCPSTIGFLTTTSCTINATFAPTAGGARTGTLTTTSLVVGGPTAALAGTGTRSGNASATKCKKKGKKKAKKGAVAAKKKHGKKCGKKKRRSKK